MKTLIDKLIEDAGFSKTYEYERLRLLIHLTALYCLKQYTQDITEYKSGIINDFGLKRDL